MTKFDHDTLRDYYTSVTKDLIAQKENILLEQLNDLISRGLLVIEETQPTLVRDYLTDKIILQQSVKLTLKDKEYILKLEEENKQLKEKLESIEKAFKGE